MAEPRILRDLRALKPMPRGIVVWGDPPVKYAIRSVVDMKNKELVDLFAFDRPDGDRENMAEQQMRLGKQILLVCPDFPPEELERMTWQQTADFHTAALGAGPPPLALALSRLLDQRMPCEGACEHPECPYLHELWALKERMAEAATPAPLAGTPPLMAAATA